MAKKKDIERSILEILTQKTGLSPAKLLAELKKNRAQISCENAKHGRPSIVEDRWPECLVLASAGFKPWTIAQICGINPQTLYEYLKAHPEKKEELHKHRLNKYLTLLNVCMKQAKKGYFPAIQFLLERLFGDMLSLYEMQDKEGPDEFVKKTVKEFVVKVTEYEKNGLAEQINADNEIDDFEDADYTESSEVIVKHKTPAELGENLPNEQIDKPKKDKQ